MGSCAAPSAKGDDKFITTDYLQQCPIMCLVHLTSKSAARFYASAGFTCCAASQTH
ncbi:replication initiator protein [Escherichia coli]|nr:replication initiator protein [Escherichia coli]